MLLPMVAKWGFGLFALSYAIGLFLVACGGGRQTPAAGAGATGGNGATGAHALTAIGPKRVSESQLRNEAALLGRPLYWAGPQLGFNYEFTRTTRGYFYIRYLPE